jgi:hypothetical protein
MGWYRNKNFEVQTIDVLEGKVIESIEINEEESEITFNCYDGKKYLMYHEQDCCESVTIEDITGDVNCLLNAPITMAEVVTEEGYEEGTWGDSCTWTFYKLATVKGYVTIRWYGTSNGYYSEEVDFVEVVKEIR